MVLGLVEGHSQRIRRVLCVRMALLGEKRPLPALLDGWGAPPSPICMTDPSQMLLILQPMTLAREHMNRAPSRAPNWGKLPRATPRDVGVQGRRRERRGGLRRRGMREVVGEGGMGRGISVVRLRRAPGRP